MTMTTDRTTRVITAASVSRVVPMGPQLDAEASLLRQALSSGLVAVEDPKRAGFYSVDCQGSALYIHLHEAGKTIYLLARLPKPETVSRPLQTVTADEALTGCTR